MIRQSVADPNILEDNFLRCFSPIYRCQMILGSVRVNIKNNVVSPTTAWQNVYSLLWLVLVTYSYSFYMAFYQREYYNKSTLMYLSCIFGTGMEHTAYFLTNSINRFTQRKNNVKIYLMLQNVDRTLQLEKYKYYTDFNYRFSILILISIFVGFLSGFSANAISLLDKPGHTVFYGLGLLTIFYDMLLGFTQIYFLSIRMRHFNGIIKNHIDEDTNGNRKKKPKQRTWWKRIVSLIIPDVRKSNATLRHDMWLGCLRDILKCYKLITELYSFAVLLYSLTVLIWTFIVIGAIVLGNRSGLYPLSASITIAMWAGFYYTQLTISALFNDWFIQEVANMKLLCIRLVSGNINGPYQKTACEIIRTIHYEKPVFNVYGLFVFDRRLPLEIIGVIASNVMVMIQFLI